jgi:protein-tyrosine phosphatase
LLDLHCHILPNVDDGAFSLEESLGMARFCVQDGISHLVATPHYHRHTRVPRAEILRHVGRLNDALAEAAVSLTILPGSEVQVTDTSEYRRDFEAGRIATWATAVTSLFWSSAGRMNSTHPKRRS